jgi:hypothetical protein
MMEKNNNKGMEARLYPTRTYTLIHIYHRWKQKKDEKEKRDNQDYKGMTQECI